MIDSFLNIGFHTCFYYIAAKYWIQDYILQFFALFSVPLVKFKTMQRKSPLAPGIDCSIPHTGAFSVF